MIVEAGQIEAVIFGNMVYLDAGGIHAQIPNEADFKPWIRMITKRFDLMPGCEVLEIRGKTYISQTAAGMAFADVAGNDRGKLKSIRGAIADAVEGMYSILNKSKHDRDSVAIDIYEASRIKILNYINERKSVISSDISRRFNKINSRQRNAIIDELISSGSVEKQFIRINNSKKSSCVYTWIGDDR